MIAFRRDLAELNHKIQVNRSMNLIVESWFVDSVRPELTKQRRKFIAHFLPLHVYSTMSAQHRRRRYYQHEHPIHAFPRDLSARCCLTFLMHCCSSLKVALRPSAEALVYCIFMFFQCLGQYVFLCCLICIPPIGDGDTIRLLHTVIQWFSSIRSKPQQDSPTLLSPKGNKQTSLMFTVYFCYRRLLRQAWGCIFVNMCMCASSHVFRIDQQGSRFCRVPSCY